MLEIQGVQRKFDKLLVLRGIDLTINDGEIVCLLGPSGCGKTTLLRIIAGLETADSGSILMDGQNIQSVPTHQRGFGLMFQDFALFPHMNVLDNVAFGLRMQNLPLSEQQSRVYPMLDLVGLRGFGRRDVTHLSGGERQRVALARSLAPNPRLLMLDEPLGSLDAALREDLIVELRTVIKQLHLTAIYVTHDQHEAFAIADRIAVMNAGHIEQFAAPTELYQHPNTAFVAHFLGLDNIVRVTNQQNGIATTPIGNFPVSTPSNEILLHTDFLTVVPPSSSDSIPAIVTQVVFQGDSYRLTVRHVSGTTLTLKYPVTSPTPHVGDTLAIQIAPNAFVPLVVPEYEVRRQVAGLLDSFLSSDFPETALVADDSSALDALSISLIGVGRNDVDQILERFKENPSRLTFILGQIGDARAIKPLIEYLRVYPNDTATIYALGEIGDAQAIDPLVNLLRDQKSTLLRSYILSALAKIPDPRSREALENFASDTSILESDRNEATKLLSRFPIGREREARARDRAKRRKM